MATTRQPKQLLYKRATAASVLDESVSSVIRKERLGLLTPIVKHPGGTVHYAADEVEALARPNPGNERKAAVIHPAMRPKPIKRERLIRRQASGA